MKLILGSMTFGDRVERDTAGEIIDLFQRAGYREIDTAYDYCKGATEKMLGQLLPPDKRNRIHLASKVNPWNERGLRPEQVKKQFGEILQRLGSDSIDLLYLHSPDLETPVEQTLEACFALYRQGRFRQFGLSNYAAWQVAEVVELCRSHGWMQPTVYQGLYNALTRDVERELFPCLRHYGIAFYAYNPLAGGMLTGRYRDLDSLPDIGRFADNDEYQQRYWKQDYFGVSQQFFAACEARDLSPTAAAMSWLVNHSRLDAEHGDGIILGVSRIEHLKINMAACRQAPLDNDIIDILDRGWEIIKPNCFKYFRP